jgi:hypothetical protein
MWATIDDSPEANIHQGALQLIYFRQRHYYITIIEGRTLNLTRSSTAGLEAALQVWGNILYKTPKLSYI